MVYGILIRYSPHPREGPISAPNGSITVDSANGVQYKAGIGTILITNSPKTCQA